MTRRGFAVPRLGRSLALLALGRKFSENASVLVSASHRRERLSSVRLPGTVWFGSAPVDPVRRLPTGNVALDGLLGGGWPRGHLSEIAGAPSSGRTALLHLLLASATCRGEVAAVVDPSDMLDPATLAGAGADLPRILWVRPPSSQTALKCAEMILTAGGFGLLALDLPSGAREMARRLPAHTWPRLAQIAKRAGAAVIVLAPQRVAGGTAAVALTLTQRRVRWSGALFEGITSSASLTRSRFGPAERTITLTVGERLVGARHAVPLAGVKAERLPVGLGGEGAGGRAAQR